MKFNVNSLFDKKDEIGFINVLEVVEEFYEKYGDKIAPEIINNTAFREMIYSSLYAITQYNHTTQYGKENQTDVEISPDGKSITLTSNGRENPMFDVSKVPNIICYQAKIDMAKDGFLHYDFSSGTAYDKQKFKDEMKI